MAYIHVTRAEEAAHHPALRQHRTVHVCQSDIFVHPFDGIRSNRVTYDLAPRRSIREEVDCQKMVYVTMGEKEENRDRMLFLPKNDCPADMFYLFNVGAGIDYDNSTRRSEDIGIGAEYRGFPDYWIYLNGLCSGYG